MVIQVIAVALVLIFPQIAMWFPNWLQERMKAERLKEESTYQQERHEGRAPPRGVAPLPG
jgi:hypothetical protein